jgi:hypothetical protein
MDFILWRIKPITTVRREGGGGDGLVFEEENFFKNRKYAMESWSE